MSLFSSFFKFLNENLGAVTFIVGFLAIYLYLKQRKDRKRDAARMIVQEIRHGEQQIRYAKLSQVPLLFNFSVSSRLLPTNSWNDNRHLFTKDLTETEIDMISAFYSKTTYIDSLIAERSRQKTNPHLTSTAPMNAPSSASVTAQPTSPGVGSPQPMPPQQFMPVVLGPGPLEEFITSQLISEVSSSVEFLYNTPATEKLRKISEKKWYQPY
jgi:hypothetical protein